MKKLQLNPFPYRIFTVSSEVLMSLGKNSMGIIYSTKLSKIINVTPITMFKSLNKLEDIGLIETEKKGRKRYIKLTDKGKEVSYMLMDLQTSLGIPPNLV